MKTTVIHIKDADREDDVYIGRAGKGHDGYFGNPFKLKNEEDREDVIRQYALYFFSRLRTDAEFERRIHELKGKRLACFCSPKLCHGHIIMVYLDFIMRV